MTDPSPPELEALLERCILALEQGDQPAVDAVLADHPQHAEQLRQRIAQLAAMGLLEAPRGSEPKAIPDRLGEFELLRQIGRGGMGVVYLAEQPALERQVALKLVHPEQLYFAGARERFRREVLAIARLRHPGIVPILTGGEAEGIPFYAMELVHGASLAEVLDELVGTAPAALEGATLRTGLERAMRKKQDPMAVHDAPIFHGAWANVCCRLLLQAVEALQHAHEQGVLHRDLKPSNLLLTNDGQLRLIDFGLASAEGQQRITRSGAALGSKPYMAPEQVRGEAQRIDVRTDVYQLGVTLYELLTTKLPHGDGSADTHERILAGVVDAPSRRNPHVHPDTDAICLKAIDLDPARRYASVARLGDDLRAFLEQRTVAARRPPAWVRGQRWIRRHPMRAAITLVAFVLFVVGPVVLATQQHAANRSIRRALAETERQRALAETNFDAALKAVEQMLLRTAAARLAEIPRTAQLRRQLVQDAIDIHRHLADTAAEGDDARLAEQRARSQFRLGDLHLELGDLQAAQRSFEAARETFLQLTARPGLGDEMQYEAARCDEQLGIVHLRSERPTLALAAMERAVQAVDALASTMHGQLHRRLSIRTRLSYARTLARVGRVPEAEALFDQIDELLVTPAADPAHRLAADDRANYRARVAASRATIAAHAGDTRAALEQFLEAMRRANDLPPDAPVGRTLRAQRAQLASQLGSLYQQRRQWERALPWVERGIAEYRALHELEPDLPAWRAKLARNLGALANCLEHGVDPAQSLRAHDEAINMLEQVTAEAPDEVRYRTDLALVYAERADSHLIRGDVEAAVADFAESRRRFEDLLARHPDQPSLAANYAVLLANQASSMAGAGELQQARRTMTRAVELHAAMSGIEARRTTIEMLTGAANFAALDDDADEAIALMQRATERAAALLAEDPDDVVPLTTATMVATNYGALLLSLDRPPEAIRVWLEALPTARRTAAASRYGEQLLTKLKLRLAIAHLLEADTEAARRWFAEAVEHGATRSLVDDTPRLSELFDREELRDLVPPGADK